MYFASRMRDARVAAAVVRHVVIADWVFTSTTIVLQPLSGLYLMHLAGFPWSASWIVWSFALYLVAGACWLPVVWDADPDARHGGTRRRSGSGASTALLDVSSTLGCLRRPRLYCTAGGLLAHGRQAGLRLSGTQLGFRKAGSRRVRRLANQQPKRGPFIVRSDVTVLPRPINSAPNPAWRY